MTYLPSEGPVLVQLEKRYYATGYAYFGFVALAIVLIMFFICAANSRRIKRGQNPYISQYLSPPSYIESQGNPQGQQQENVPMYYQSANPNQDAGYYDANGNFVPSNKPLSPTNNAGYNSNVQQAYIPNDNSENMFYQQNTTGSTPVQNYTRPAGPPPGRPVAETSSDGVAAAAGTAGTATAGGSGKNSAPIPEQPPAFDDVVNSNNYSRPDGPPPSRT